VVKKTLSFFSRVILTIRQAMERESDQFDRPDQVACDLFRFILGAVYTGKKFFGSLGLQFVKSTLFNAETFNVHTVCRFGDHPPTRKRRIDPSLTRRVMRGVVRERNNRRLAPCRSMPATKRTKKALANQSFVF